MFFHFLFSCLGLSHKVMFLYLHEKLKSKSDLMTELVSLHPELMPDFKGASTCFRLQTLKRGKLESEKQKQNLPALQSQTWFHDLFAL